MKTSHYVNSSKIFCLGLVLPLLFSYSGCKKEEAVVVVDHVTPIASLVTKQLVEGAIEQTKYTHSYDPRYVKLSYPGGDVPLETGVCADVVVRAFRNAGVDLQKELHEDMVRNFARYPKKWGLKKPDTNIDHRRVANLMTYFNRCGKSLPITSRKEEYLPGDVIAWRFSNGLLHVGIVTNLVSQQSQQNLVIHNVGGGAQLEDVLFGWTVIGHYRYF